MSTWLLEMTNVFILFFYQLSVEVQHLMVWKMTYVLKVDF